MWCLLHLGFEGMSQAQRMLTCMLLSYYNHIACVHVNILTVALNIFDQSDLSTSDLINAISFCVLVHLPRAFSIMIAKIQHCDILSSETDRRMCRRVGTPLFLSLIVLLCL